MTIQDICIYADYKADESYTPNRYIARLFIFDHSISFCCAYRISIRAGNHFNDLSEIEQVELSEPSGWVVIALRDLHGKAIRTFMIQIAVLSNHQNGRDTHMRQIKIHSPVQEASVTKKPNFTTVEMSQYSCIR
jgi:anaphase-promoting complex subunit 10